MAESSRGTYNPFALMQPVASFELTSTEIAEGQPLPASVFGARAGGLDRSPQLSWSGAPEGTRSYAITCFDPDAPTGSGFWHWSVINIPADVTSLEADAGDPANGLLPEGAITMPNEYRQLNFIGAGPPEGTGVHHYWFAAHALNVERIDINPQATPAVTSFMMREAVIGRAILVATGEFGGAA